MAAASCARAPRLEVAVLVPATPATVYPRRVHEAPSPLDLLDLLDRYAALCRKVDEFAARVQARHHDEMQCRPGCDGCCRARLTITGVEAEAIRAWLEASSPEARAQLRAAAARSDVARCAALDDDGLCRIYAARPLVCRSHGVAIRVRSERGLPLVHACDLNFARRDLSTLEPSDVLDQETLSTVLFAIDAALARARGEAPGARHDLAALLVNA